MNTRFALPPVLVLCIFLLSCGMEPPEHAELNAVRTEAVSTYISSLTGTHVPQPTATFTPTSLPTFTPSGPTPTSTPLPPTQNTCYNLIWIEDRTIPDGMSMKANETFTKTWLVQNNGGCAWAPGFRFSHVGGDPMRGEAIVLQEPIPVGAKREISVKLVVPSGTTGWIQSSWRMMDTNGDYFGDTLTVKILVGDLTTPSGTEPAP